MPLICIHLVLRVSFINFWKIENLPIHSQNLGEKSFFHKLENNFGNFPIFQNCEKSSEWGQSIHGQEQQPWATRFSISLFNFQQTIYMGKALRLKPYVRSFENSQTSSTRDVLSVTFLFKLNKSANTKGLSEKFVTLHLLSISCSSLRISASKRLHCWVWV